MAAPFVMLDERKQVLGYYTLSAYGVRMTELPAVVTKRLPRYPVLPATLLGRLAISQAHTGMKLGRLLLADALHRSWRNTTEVASVGVVAEAINDAACSFYAHHEFLALAGHPKKFFIAMKTLEKAFASSS
ncbi:MAG: GNAT family N-acetyltransferase [Acidobacteriota bacterium]